MNQMNEERRQPRRVVKVRGWWQVEGISPHYRWTVFCKDSDSKRGEYVEEFDVATAGKSQAAAKKVAERVLAQEDYDRSVRVSRVEQRQIGFWF